VRDTGVTIDGVQALLPAILSAVHIQTLIHGNTSEASARQLVHTIERCLGKRDDGIDTLQPLYSNQFWRAREVQLNEGVCTVPTRVSCIHRSFLFVRVRAINTRK
jgi:hypothetical protein